MDAMFLTLRRSVHTSQISRLIKLEFLQYYTGIELKLPVRKNDMKKEESYIYLEIEKI